MRGRGWVCSGIGGRNEMEPVADFGMESLAGFAVESVAGFRWNVHL